MSRAQGWRAWSADRLGDAAGQHALLGGRVQRRRGRRSARPYNNDKADQTIAATISSMHASA